MSDISSCNNINIYIIMEIQPQSTSSLIFKFFVFIGLFFFLKKIYNFVSWIYKSFLLPPVDFKKEYGDGWAVITGGSDGIGFAFAEEFLKQNLKICIIARNEEKIKKVIEQLKEKYKNGNVKYIVWDFDKRYTNEEINELKNKFSSELNNDISILYNNVGNVARGKLTELSNEEIQTMFNINIAAPTFITKIVIDLMLKRKEKSLVFFSGAVMGRMRFATRQVYSSAKSYLESFSECLAREYPSIDFTCLNIGPVESNFNRAKMPFTVKPRQFAESAVNKLGRYGFTGGCIQHDIFWFLFWNIPFLSGMIHKKMGAKPKSI